MNALDAMQSTMNAVVPSMVALATLIRDEIDLVGTRLPRRASNVARNAGALGDAPERHDGEMLPPATMLDDQLDHGTGSVCPSG